jgi:hypothetical protein
MKLLGVLALAACSKPPPATPPPVVDLPTLDDFVRDFDAHAGEARFLTLLSPT